MIFILFKENISNIIILMSKEKTIINNLNYCLICKYQYYLISFNIINLWMAKQNEFFKRRESYQYYTDFLNIYIYIELKWSFNFFAILFNKSIPLMSALFYFFYRSSIKIVSQNILNTCQKNYHYIQYYIYNPTVKRSETVN